MENNNICDSCGLEKDGIFHLVYDENYNKEISLQICDKCFSEKLDINEEN